ncbi:hypothetical protein C2E21_5610 [Chlorella sorokiniana]|uniref:Uncharacterized protein n=1 Tax=Chlorella sorokiniana TaxID=3076 RepID=A0A2P6TNZ4_CHLSO|nr:hypothetical protein C2E21_5610 [Chlorella sorokiniana]|eukprot:PRW51054.1 hypothetical protein C2E21_5610 [Chlorella sorokiniana]
MLAAAALAPSRPSLLACRPARRPAARRAPVAPRAFAPMEIVQLAADAAEKAPGTVDAPIWAIVVGAVVVTAASFALSAGLKSGTDAASQMQKRDAKKFNKYD